MRWVVRCVTTTVSALIVTVAGLVVATPAAAATRAYVSAGGGPLNSRSAASTVDRLVRSLPHGTGLSINCQVYGQYVVGNVRRTPYWNRLFDGSYVSDAYVRWTPRRPIVPWCRGASATTATVRNPAGPVNMRSGPGTTTRVLGALRSGTRLSIVCQAWGQQIRGSVRTSSAWDRLTGGQYVSDAFVAWHPGTPSMPFCGQQPPTIPPVGAEAFLARVGEPARAGRRQYQVPASVTIAQAILESGWARSGLTRRDHNFFGIKCFGNPGTIAVGCRSYPTYECGRGGCYRTSATFRAYRSAAGSFADHGYFLRVNPRYRPAFAHVNNPNRFAQEIHKAGYATSPTYATNLINIMRRYNLYRYDR
ncbi:MAG TPA: sporangiospore maturation cell wall hydrolase GsmA [Catenuloplanes sp.]